MDDLFKEDNVPSSDWWKPEKVGDRIWGVLVGTSHKEARDGFEAQTVFTLKQEDGAVIKYGVADTKEYVISRASSAEMGDLLGFEFKKEVPSKTKGYSPAKSIEVYVKKSDENKANDEFKKL